MTEAKREKLIEDMAQAIKDGEWIDSIEQAAAALAIAEAAFAKEIEAAYKEGWDDNDESPHNTSYEREHGWIRSHARASILASIPEKNDG